MNYRDIFRTANSNLLRSKTRTLLTIISIFIGAFTISLTVGLTSGISAYIDEQLGNVGAEDMLIIQGKGADPFTAGTPKKYQEGTNTTSAAGLPMVLLDQEDLDVIKAQPHIKSAELDVNTAPNYLYGPSDQKYSFLAANFYDGLKLTPEAGEIADNKSSQKQILLVPSYVEPLGFKSAEDAVGKTLKIGVKTPTGEQVEVDATVVGVQKRSLMSTGGIILNRALVKEIYSLQTQGLPAELTSQQPVATARFDTSISDEQMRDLKKALDKKGYTASTIQDQIGIFKQVIDAVMAVLVFFGAIALLAASFGIINTLYMAVQERTKEIGLMKAMGMGRRRVFLLFSVEAMLIGFWGSLLGALAAIGVGKAANQVAANTFLKELVGFDLTSFPLTSVAGIIFIVMLIAFLAGTLPARRASKLDPIEALRYE